MLPFGVFLAGVLFHWSSSITGWLWFNVKGTMCQLLLGEASLCLYWKQPPGGLFLQDIPGRCSLRAVLVGHWLPVVFSERYPVSSFLVGVSSKQPWVASGFLGMLIYEGFSCSNFLDIICCWVFSFPTIQSLSFAGLRGHLVKFSTCPISIHGYLVIFRYLE